MLKLVRAIISRLVCRFRSRAVLELENVALRHQLQVLRRQRPGRLRLFMLDRLLWDHALPIAATLSGSDGVGQAGNGDPVAPSGLPLFWRRRSRSGRPSVEREVRDLIRQ